MSTLNELRNHVGRAWEGLAEGWGQLRSRASHALTRFSPVRHSAALDAETDRLMSHGARWGLLSAEVQETGRAIIVRLEAPGMERDDFEVFVQDDLLVVRGEKQAHRKSREGLYHVMECAYGSFERAVPLPVPVDEDDARARYRRGVLEISLPKAARGSRRIDVTKE